MRRIIIIGTALAMLGASTPALAAYNNYTGTKLVLTAAKGTKAKPVRMAMTQILKVSAPSGHRAAPLTNINIKIYGVKLDVGKLPVCSNSLILKNKTKPNGGCSKGSVIGTGPVHSVLGPGGDPTATGTPCNPFLNVFNGGPGKQVFFFHTNSQADCSGLTTGATAPWEATISYAGATAVINNPLPPDISTKVANQPGLYSSLLGETIAFPRTAAGKSYMVGVGCKNGNRPWSVTYTAHLYTGSNETQTISGSSGC